MNRIHTSLLLTALFLVLAPTALASTTWYVNGVTGNDGNNCMSATTACKTIGHAISLASSGDSIMVAASTYNENFTIGISVQITGSGAGTTIIDGGGVATVVTISSNAAVTLSNVSIRDGFATNGGGVNNSGTLTINSCIVTANRSVSYALVAKAFGGGIYNAAVLTINDSEISGNTATASSGNSQYAYGGGIAINAGNVTINRSTISGNIAAPAIANRFGRAYGGGIAILGGTVLINNSTIDGNAAKSTFYGLSYGGGIYGGASIRNTTISGNGASYGGGLYQGGIQNSIVAYNSAQRQGGNCFGAVSLGYNLSSDKSCNFNGTGDINNTNPNLGPLQNNGGPTRTRALPSGSPAIDAGDPGGCTDRSGLLLKTDQRGMPRPDGEDKTGCDMGAYERQSD